MRAIKFRGWHKLSKRMYGVGYLHFAPNGELYGLLADETTEWGNMLAADDFEIMQYTGLKDRSGKEIFEGDIVQSVQPIFQRREPERVVIEFTDGILAYGCDPFVEIAGSGWQSATPDECEIIGNIYENPGLLEEA